MPMKGQSLTHSKEERQLIEGKGAGSHPLLVTSWSQVGSQCFIGKVAAGCLLYTPVPQEHLQTHGLIDGQQGTSVTHRRHFLGVQVLLHEHL